MMPVSQIIWKNRQKLDRDKPLLLVCPEADALAVNLESEGFEVTALCHSYASHEQLGAAGIKSDFQVAPQAGGVHEQVVLFQPREKSLLNMMLSLCGASLSQGGQLWLAGANRAGIRSAGKRLGDFFGEHRKVDSARHCALYLAENPVGDTASDLESYRESWTFSAAGREWRIVSLPGVFAHGRLDEGSRLLLDTLTNSDLKDELGGRILDFACGAGVIGIPLAGSIPGSQLTLLDNSAIAMRCAQQSLRVNGISAELVASDGLGQFIKTSTQPFDWIVSNPPFHSGVQTDPGIVERFSRDCSAVLKPGGRLCLVANVHLPYGRLLDELFDSVQVIASDRGYNIWLAK